MKMTMKKIIAFVLFALMIYAGGYFVVYGFNELGMANSRPLPLEMISSGAVHSGDVVAGKIYQQVKYLGDEIVQPEILNIPIGKTVKRRLYLVPLRYEKKAEDMRYYVVSLSDPASIEKMEAMAVTMPAPESGDGLEISGVAKDISNNEKTLAYMTLTTRTGLVGVDGLLRNPLAEYYYNRIIPYTVCERSGFDASWVAVAVGAALILAGIGLSILLGLKIRRERY